MLDKTLKTAATALLLSAPVTAAAEMELSLYTGWQGAPGSTLKGDYPAGGSFDRDVSWDGKSFEMPPYYGVRATWWRDANLGFGAEFTHSKVYLDDDDRDALGFDGFELTDGLNVLTANVMYRWPDMNPRITPYVGGGIGFTFPHVDADIGNSDTYGFQIGGPAVRVLAGAQFGLTDRTALFAEYQFTASSNDLDLDGGGSAETVVKTNALNLGVSFTF